MIRLPGNLPEEIRSALAPHLQTDSLEEALQRAAQAVRVLFGAQDVLMVCERGPEDSRAERQLSYATGEVLFLDSEAARRFVRRWFEEKVHFYVRRDLESRLASISHSAFSWPYPQLAPQSQGGKVPVPRDYTLLLPFSSQLIIGDEGELPFLGYLALFFDSFPSLNETAVQMIISLPELLSDLTAAFLRRASMLRAEELSLFCHDVKRYLLLNRELIALVRSGQQKKVKKAVDGAERGLLHLLHRANGLLLRDRLLEGGMKIQPLLLDLNELIANAAEELQPLFEGKGVTLRLELSSILPQVNADPTFFPSVIQNLVHNALKYSAEGGQVTIQTAEGTERRVLILIKDKGAPIPDDEVPTLFDRQFRGENSAAIDGHGLGLYVVRRIVEAHNGLVRLEQEETEKRFIIELPL